MNRKHNGPILCFGEVLLRLGTSPGVRLANASSLSVDCGGAEANVGAMLAQLGHPAEMVTVLPRSPLGDLCEAELRRTGLGTAHAIRSDGRVGLYFFEPAAGGSGRVIYDRAGSAFWKDADRFDWPALASNARWFHVSGINLALGGKDAIAAVESVEAMRAAGATISFDVNHRASLWEGREEEDPDLVYKVAGMADVMFASVGDLSRLLKQELPHDTPEDRRAAALRAFDSFESLGLIASTRRTFAQGGQQLSAVIDSRDGRHETPEAPVGPIVDRVGSGDSFAGGVIDGLLRSEPIDRCAENGLAAAVMKHGIAGDRWVGTRDDLAAFDPFARSDIRR